MTEGAHAQVWPRTCTQCGTTITNERGWEQHLRSTTHLGEANRQPVARCDYCGKSFVRGYGLKRHLDLNRCKAPGSRDCNRVNTSPHQRHEDDQSGPSAIGQDPLSFPTSTILPRPLDDTLPNSQGHIHAPTPNPSANIIQYPHYHESLDLAIYAELLALSESFATPTFLSNIAGPATHELDLSITTIFEKLDEMVEEAVHDPWGIEDNGNPWAVDELPAYPATLDCHTPVPSTDIQQRVHARLTAGARVSLSSAQAIGASQRRQREFGSCPLCRRPLRSADPESSIRHFLKHLNVNVHYPCHDCEISFATANDLEWHKASARKHKTCGFEFAHTTITCSSGHHPPSKEAVHEGAPNDHYRLQLWCLATWNSAIHRYFLKTISYLWEEVASSETKVSLAWSIGNGRRRPCSQVSEDALTSAIDSLSMSQRSEPALGRAERWLHMRRPSTQAADAESQELLAPLLDSRVEVHQSKLASDLLLACRVNDAEGVRRCIQAGVVLDFPAGADRQTPLYIAASRGHFEIIRMLLEAGASINYRNHECGTALAAAIVHRRPRMAAFLLDQGAKQDHILGHQSAIDIALANSYYELVDILLGAHPSRDMITEVAGNVYKSFSSKPFMERMSLLGHDKHLQSFLARLCSHLPDFDMKDKTTWDLVQACGALALASIRVDLETSAPRSSVSRL